MVYRVVTHELKLCSRWELDSHITYKQLLDMLEIIETHEAIKQIAIEKAKAEAVKNNKKG